MKYYAGLDVSVKETSVCIVDEKGNICRERKVVGHPDDLVSFLRILNERVALKPGRYPNGVKSALRLTFDGHVHQALNVSTRIANMAMLP